MSARVTRGRVPRGSGRPPPAWRRTTARIRLACVSYPSMTLAPKDQPRHSDGQGWRWSVSVSSLVSGSPFTHFGWAEARVESLNYSSPEALREHVSFLPRLLLAERRALREVRVVRRMVRPEPINPRDVGTRLDTP